MIKSLIFFIGILLSVAFLTLVERKILSFMQLRKGPNLVGILGLMQPIGDGLKLVSKQTIYNLFSNLFIFYVPLFFFFFSLVIWISILEMQGMKMSNNFLFFLFLSSFGALLIFLSGWSGGSTFSFLGGIRASAQMISYEVVLSFFFLIPMIYFFNLSFHLLNEKVFILSNWSSILPIMGVTLITILAETNRAPFDLTEGESELVSGFNTEFSSTLFVLLFLGEYSFMILFSVLFSLMVLNSFFWWFFFLMVFLWVRACFPRKRYDFLMYLMWVILFPFACWMILFYLWMILF